MDQLESSNIQADGPVIDDRFIRTLEDIKPQNLKSYSYPNYVQRISKIARKSIESNACHLFLLLDSIKACRKPCYKRDTLLDVLDHLLASTTPNGLLDMLFSHAFCSELTVNNKHPAKSLKPWKELANSLTSVPDLVANCDALAKYPSLNKNQYYGLILDKIYTSLYRCSQACSSSSSNTTATNKIVETTIATSQTQDDNHLSSEQRLFLLQVIGRIAISDRSQLVWSRLIVRIIDEKKPQLTLLLSDIMRPMMLVKTQNENIMLSFEPFIDHLIMPMFHNLMPSRQSGLIIQSLLGSDALSSSEHFKYAVCDRSILRANYNLDRHRQSIILHNIFSYLARLVNQHSPSIHQEHNQLQAQFPSTDGGLVPTLNEDVSSIRHHDGISVLVKILLVVVEDWSNTRKILLRVHEHNRYLTCALLVAFKYASEYDQYNLVKCSPEIESMLLRALPTYLNRASDEQRSLALCLGILLLPRLHVLIKSNSGKQHRRNSQDDNSNHDQSSELDLNFEVNDNDDFRELKQLLEVDVDELFSVRTGESKKQTYPVDRKTHNSPCALSDAPKSPANQFNKKVILLGDDDDDDDDDDDLKPYACSRKNFNDADDDSEYDDIAKVGNDDFSQVPIYLRDCINGLIDNNNARYTKLCLLRSSEIINQMLDHDLAEAERSINLYRKQLADPIRMRDGGRVHKTATDSIRDVAVELAQVLVHLENQYNIEQFDAYRRKTLTLLSVAVPDLVVKYLFAEFNGTHKSIQLQLELLQVFVASAIHISGNKTLQEDNLNSNDITKQGDHNQTKAPPVNRKERTVINKFLNYASCYFYGLVYRLKADFNATSQFNIISQPEAILARVRIEDEQDKRADSNSWRIPLDDGRGLIGMLRREPRKSGKSDPSGTTEQSVNKTGSSLVGEASDESTSDDNSYLLCRILFAVSIVIKCLHQQPITCYLSADLLDILAAYRCHPDPGVHRSIVSCLKAMKDSTPSVYFADNLERRVAHLFGPWLTNEMSLASNKEVERSSGSSLSMASSRYFKDN